MVPEQQPASGSPDPVQRAALQAALIEVMARRRTFYALTAEGVARAAGLSPETFFEHFQSVEDCYVATYERTVAEMRVAMAEAARTAAWAYGEDDWRRQLDGAVAAMLGHLSARPDLAWALIALAAEVGDQALERREAMLTAFVADLERARSRYDNPVPALASEVLVRGVFQVVSSRVLRGEAKYLRLLLDDLAQFWHTADQDQ